MQWINRTAAIALLTLGAALVWLRFPGTLEPVMLVIGAILSVLGLLLFIRLYRGAVARSGIATGSPAVMVFADVLTVLGAAVGAVGCVDSVWTAVLGRPSLVGIVPEYGFGSALTPFHFISVLGMCVGLPILTLMFTSLTAQRLEVDAEGVATLGAFGRTFLPWQAIREIEIVEQHSALMHSTGDWRALQHALELRGEEEIITINEGTAGRKQAVLALLAERIPPDLTPMFERARLKW